MIAVAWGTLIFGFVGGFVSALFVTGLARAAGRGER